MDLWRPIAGIREADADGNPLTASDPDWQPLNAFTPPFPAYISGHATFASAAAATFTRFFETDGITHTIGTEDPLYAGGPRRYTNFLDDARENARSRDGGAAPAGIYFARIEGGGAAVSRKVLLLR